jgi:hypothetical protein
MLQGNRITITKRRKEPCLATILSGIETAGFQGFYAFVPIQVIFPTCHTLRIKNFPIDWLIADDATA